MQLVNDTHVHTRFSNGCPQTLELVCPHCQKEAGFMPKSWHEHGRQVAVAEAPCSRCEDSVLFLQLLEENNGIHKTADLYLHPPSSARGAVRGVEHLAALSGPLGRTYESALKLYNQTEWGASALMVRHLLEGLSTRLLGDDKRDLPLPRQLDALAGIDLARPLQDVASLLSPDGSFGREFHDEAGIDQATAEQLLELTEYLIAYLVVLPGAMAELKSRIATAPVPLRRSSTG